MTPSKRQIVGCLVFTHQFLSGVAKESLQQLRHKGETPSTEQKERKLRELEDSNDDYYTDDRSVGDDNAFFGDDYTDDITFGMDDWYTSIGDDNYAPVDDVFWGDDWFIPADDIYFVDQTDPIYDDVLIDDSVHYDDYYYQRASKKGSKKGKGGKKGKKGKKSGKKGGGGGGGGGV
jgi:uncharacterized membrane protein YgcG